MKITFLLSFLFSLCLFSFSVFSQEMLTKEQLVKAQQEGSCIKGLLNEETSNKLRTLSKDEGKILLKIYFEQNNLSQQANACVKSSLLSCDQYCKIWCAIQYQRCGQTSQCAQAYSACLAQ